MRSALRSTHSTVGWWSVAGRSVKYFVFFSVFNFCIFCPEMGIFADKSLFPGGRDGVPRVLPDGHPHPHALGQGGAQQGKFYQNVPPCQEDAQTLPPPPQRHLSLRGVLRRERAAHGRRG